MPMEFDDLRVLKAAESLADDVWHDVIRWDEFPRTVFGKQIVRAVDSIGANIAEAFGRYHYGEKLQFLYYARGSLYESKYWLNRAFSRRLLSEQRVEDYAERFSELVHQINAFAKTIKHNRSKSVGSAFKEPGPVYFAENSEEDLIFDASDLDWLRSFSNEDVKPPF